MCNNIISSKDKFINTYGAAAYLKLSMLGDILREKNIDIRKVDKKQIARLLGYSDIELE